MPPRRIIPKQIRGPVTSPNVVIHKHETQLQPQPTPYHKPHSTVRRVLQTVGEGVVVKKSTIDGSGYGLFANKDFSTGDEITKYEGLLRTPAEIENIPISEQTHMKGLGSVSSHYVIDGLYGTDGIRITNPKKQRHGKGGGALANHSSRRTNADFDFVDTPIYFEKVKHWSAGTPFPHPGRSSGLGRLLFLRAIEDIKKGDEIFVNYGKIYTKKHGIPYA